MAAKKTRTREAAQRATTRKQGMEPQSSGKRAVRRRRVRIALGGGASVTGAVSEPARGPLNAALALGHGAGGTLDQPLLVALADGLAACGALVVRFNFPYSEAGRRAPDRAPALLATVAAAARWLAAQRRARGVPLVLGGKSMGGRMASMLVAGPDSAAGTMGASPGGPPADGLLLVGYPLHPAGRPTELRSEHLPRIDCPVLFLAGTRDPLCELPRLRPVLRRMGRRATLFVVEGGDHSFAVPRARGVSASAVEQELVGVCARWLGGLRRVRR